MKPGSRDDAVRILERVTARILGLEGMQRFLNLQDSQGRGHVIAQTGPPVISAATAAEVQAIWAEFASHPETAPTPESCGVLADRQA